MTGRQTSARAIGISGLGAVTGYGIGTAALAQGLRSGRSAIRALGAGEMDAMRALRIGAPCPAMDAPGALDQIIKHVPSAAEVARPLLRSVGPGLLAALVAAAEAVAMHRAATGSDTDKDTDTDNDTDMAIVVAGSNLFSAANAMAELAQDAGRRPSARHAVEMFDSHAVATLSALFSVRGPGFSVGAASASGVTALLAGLDMLRAGRAKHCLVVALPADLGAAGWAGLDLIGALADGRCDLVPLCRPFDKDASGLVPGECAAAVVLTTQTADLCITGSAMALDATNQPTPSKAGEIRVIQRALSEADVPPASLDLVSAHASSTAVGDLTEAQALADVLGAAASHVPVNAPKGLIGHGIAAAGLIETVACGLQMQHGFVHPNLGLQVPVAPLHYVGHTAQHQPVQRVLKTAFGFGGFNAALVLETVS